MIEKIGICQKCGSVVYCRDGFLDGYIDGKSLICFPCFYEQNKEKN